MSDYTNRIIEKEKTIRKYLSDKELHFYQREFELVFRVKPHTLSTEQEKIMSKTSIFHGGFSTIFNTLSDTDIKFDDAYDSKKHKVPLKTIADVMINIKAKDRILRKST
jgi:oligoendopeptidase F